jgi:polyisoprenoid-binding protein YceI
MQAPTGQSTAPAVQALLEDGALAGEWVLDLSKSSIRLKSKSMGLLPVNGDTDEGGTDERPSGHR